MTTFNTFVSSTPALASEVNDNFSFLQGTISPFDTAGTLTDLTSDLGQATQRWKILYVGSVNAANVTVSGTATFNGPIVGNSTVTFNGPVTVNSTATFNGPITANSTVTFNGLFTANSASNFNSRVSIGLGNASTSSAPFILEVISTNATEYTPTDAGNSKQGILRISNIDTAASEPFATIGFRLDKSGTDGFLGFIAGTSGNTGKFVVGNDVNEWLRIDQTGQVGIGTATPSATLEVTGDSRLEGQVGINVAGSVGTNFQVDVLRDDTTEYSAGNSLSRGTLRLINNDATPSEPFANLSFRIGKTGADGYFGFVGEGATADVGKFVWGNDSTETMRIDASGRLGIGTTAPSATLDVAGGAKATGGIDAGGSGVFIKRSVTSIGDWNMDATGTLSLGLITVDEENIRGIRAIIRGDRPPNVAVPLNGYDGAADDGTVNGGVHAMASGGVISVSLRRKPGGHFDGVNYDSTSFNRGWVIIDYV